MDIDNKHSDILADFKKQIYPEDGIKKMVQMARELMPQYK